MSSVDTAWLRMDRPTNRMVIVGVLLFDQPVDYERLKATFEARFARFDRFRCRPVEDVTGAWWEETPRFDLAKHVRRARVPGKGGPEALKRFVAKLVARPFDPRRPWWDFTLVDGYDGGSAIVSRIHHSYADGIALIRVMLSLTDGSPNAPVARGRSAVRARAARQEDGGLLGQFLEPFTGMAAQALRVSGEVAEKGLEALLNPEKVVQYARIAASVAGEIAQLATMPDDSRTRYKGKAGPEKRVAWTEPVPLDEVKAVGKVLDCSVNDVLLATVAGALRRYLVDKGDPTEGVELRALVPVNLRANESEISLGNRFGLVTLLLPVGVANPLARLYEVHHRMEALKGSYQAVVAFALLGAAGIAPNVVQQQVLDLLANKATAVMTNVPGPQEQLYMAGARLKQIMFWVPQSGDIGMGVSILSYNGGVQFGLITDAARVPDPENIIAHFRPEFDRLLMTILMEPWDVKRDPALVERELRAVLKRRKLATRKPRKARPAAPVAAASGA
ncbi:MAG TPA: wax ester/triacylglycerol synthase family O-acyltransferase [Burkholderiales bacterium]|nr:wax ester/triacylglycerol synthase family O-acyltransferase [Burkholderiales bacterium]